MTASVLIVEDDPALLRGLTDNFQNQGYQTQTACDGETALDAALAARFDLIVLDIMLPRINGFEICRQLRRNEIDSTIIMLTAKGREEEIIRGLELGADDYVTKPFSIRELMARVQAFLRRRLKPQQSVYTFGECRFDTDSHQLMKHDEVVRLTTKEYRLLEYFVHHEGRALTRGEILDAVWGRNLIVTPRSVDRCVTTLRSKIESNPKHPRWIQTIRDVGYRFELPADET